MGVRSIAACVFVAIVVTTSAAVADPVADFFRGKQIQIYVGYGAGGGYGAYARLIAHHLGRHVPGEPNVVVHNMPGPGACAPPISSSTARRTTARRPRHSGAT